MFIATMYPQSHIRLKNVISKKLDYMRRLVKKMRCIDYNKFKESTIQTAELLDSLPDEDILMVNALVKKLVIAWNPDFTKVTARERELLEKSNSEINNGDFISEESFWT